MIASPSTMLRLDSKQIGGSSLGSLAAQDRREFQQHKNTQSFAHLSWHAFKRVRQRTSLSCEEIANILDNKLVVNTGKQPGFNRNHLLFYSLRDDDWFVAIQDGLTGTVVTILPLDYHQNLAWKVSQADCEKAKELFLTAQLPKLDAVSALPKVFLISGLFLDDHGRQKARLLLKTSSAPYEDDVAKFLADDDVFGRIGDLASAKEIPFERMFSLVIRHGRNGNPVVIDLHRFDDESSDTLLQ
jgi:hypothetical protein